jgi:type IV pilus assembly protein PilV
MNTVMRKKGTAGFTMLEVMIAIVVVAFGLLGLAGLQVFALQNNQNAALRSIATVLASDVIDRMKANFEGVVAGQYDRPNTADYTTEVPSCNDAAGCGPNDLAQNDLQEWADRVAQTLPGGVGVVCLDSRPDLPANPTPAAPGCNGEGATVYVVKIWWLDDRSQTNVAGNLRYTYTAFNP